MTDGTGPTPSAAGQTERPVLTFYLGLMSSLSGGAVPGLQAAFQQCWINAYDCRDLNTIEPPSSQGLSA